MYYSLYNWIGEREITKLKRKYLLRIQKKRTQKQAQTWMKWNDTKWIIWYFQQCACVNAIYFAPVVTKAYRMKNKRGQQGVWSLKCVSLLERVGNCKICSTVVHTWAYHMEKISRRLFYIYRNWYYLWVELSGWMGSVSYGLEVRLISPSLPVGDDRYLNLSSQKRPTGGNRSVRRSGATLPLTLVLTIFVGMKWIA